MSSISTSRARRCCRCSAARSRHIAASPSTRWSGSASSCPAPAVPGRTRRRCRAATAARLARSYGSEARRLLDGVAGPADLGRAFGAGLSQREVDWLRAEEWAVTAEDILWRRGKLGLHLPAPAAHALAEYLER